jgi:hypothetical protein
MVKNIGIVTITIGNSQFQSFVLIVRTWARGWNGSGAFGMVRIWAS